MKAKLRREPIKAMVELASNLSNPEFTYFANRLAKYLNLRHQRQLGFALTSSVERSVCLHCGLKRTPEGHDPCIANLPGVQNACCGHGRKEGYIQFCNGTIIRGHFRAEQPEKV